MTSRHGILSRDERILRIYLCPLCPPVQGRVVRTIALLLIESSVPLDTSYFARILKQEAIRYSSRSGLPTLQNRKQGSGVFFFNMSGGRDGFMDPYYWLGPWPTDLLRPFDILVEVGSRHYKIENREEFIRQCVLEHERRQTLREAEGRFPPDSGREEAESSGPSERVVLREVQVQTQASVPASRAARSVTASRAARSVKASRAARSVTASGRRWKHPCHLCPKIYTKNAHLQPHLLAHAGIKPFSCDVEGCERSFLRRDELKRHSRVHTGERNYGCGFCGKKFQRSDHLKKHECTVHAGEGENAWPQPESKRRRPMASTSTNASPDMNYLTPEDTPEPSSVSPDHESTLEGA